MPKAPPVPISRPRTVAPSAISIEWSRPSNSVPPQPGGLGDTFARALGQGLSERMGQPVEVPLADGRVLRARVASPVFLDAEGARQNV